MLRLALARPARATLRMALCAAPQDELFDVCDEHNVVVGQAQRGEVHAKGLFHRAVNILVFRADRQLLLQQRSPEKDICPSW